MNGKDSGLMARNPKVIGRAAYVTHADSAVDIDAIKIPDPPSTWYAKKLAAHRPNARQEPIEFDED